MKAFSGLLLLVFSLNSFANDLSVIELKSSMGKKKVNNITVKVDYSDRVMESADKSTVTSFSKGSFSLIITNDKIQYVINSNESGFRKNLSDSIEAQIRGASKKETFTTIAMLSTKGKSELKSATKEEAAQLIQDKVHSLVQAKASVLVSDLNTKVNASIAGSVIEKVKLYCDESLTETTCMGTYNYSTIIKLQ